MKKVFPRSNCTILINLKLKHEKIIRQNSNITLNYLYEPPYYTFYTILSDGKKNAVAVFAVSRSRIRPSRK